MKLVNLPRHDSDDVKSLPQGAVRLSTTNIKHAGVPLEEYLNKMLYIDDADDNTEVPEVGSSIIADAAVSEDTTWSSKKIADEINSVDKRVSHILSNGDKIEVNAKEIVDARTGSDGNLHLTIGDAIRDQIRAIHKKIDGDVMNAVHTGANEYEHMESKISNHAIITRVYRISGASSNEITVPAIDGYALLNASNANGKKAKFFVAGVMNDIDDEGSPICTVYTNRVIQAYENIEILCAYVKISY